MLGELAKNAMKKLSLVLAMVGACAFVDEARALPAPDVYPAQGGSIRITPIYHGSLQIEYRGKVIQVDPFSQGGYRGAKKADVILITHTHPDHLDVKAIANLRKTGTRMFAPEAALDKRSIPFVSNVMVNTLKNGDSAEFNKQGPVPGLIVDAVPMYNLKRGPKPGQQFHPKGEFNGYILTLGGKRIYIAGDTEATPEMKALRNIDIAFLPMNLPYTMTPQEAAIGARAFKPRVVYPYHYRYPFDQPNTNPQQFAQALKGSGIQVKLRGWYDNAAPK